MADINQQFINEIANNMLKPTIVDTLVDDWEYDLYMNGEFINTFPAKYTLKFIGYALPTCTGMDDPKWLIQLNMKVDIDISGGNMQGNNGGDGEGGLLPVSSGDGNGSGKINTRSSSIKKSSGAKVMNDGYYPIDVSGIPTQRSIIGFANGVRDFNQKWTDRIRLAYAVAKGSMPFYKDGCAMNEFFEFGNPPQFQPIEDITIQDEPLI